MFYVHRSGSSLTIGTEKQKDNPEADPIRCTLASVELSTGSSAVDTADGNPLRAICLRVRSRHHRQEAAWQTARSQLEQPAKSEHGARLRS